MLLLYGYEIPNLPKVLTTVYRLKSRLSMVDNIYGITARPTMCFIGDSLHDIVSTVQKY